MLTILISVQVSPVYAQGLQTAPDITHIVSCTGVGGTGGGIECNWCRLVQMIGNIVQYSIYLAVMLSAIMFAYAGFLFLTNNGDRANVTKAWNIFRRAIFGTIAILAAWLIVHAIMTNLATDMGLDGGNWYSISGCDPASPQTKSTDIDFDNINNAVPIDNIPGDELEAAIQDGANSDISPESINVFQ